MRGWGLGVIRTIFAMPFWTDDFAPFTLLHGLSTAFFFACIASFLLVAHRVSGTAHERTFRRAWIAFVVLFQTCFLAWHLWPGHFDVRISLPLQMCDLVPLIAIPALGMRSRPLLAIVFYWGLGLCTQAFITPTLQWGPASVRFWLFFGTHAQIVASAMYAPIALKFVPTFRDARTAMMAIIPYGVVATLVNLAFDANYGFGGRTKPANPTILDKLGDWPVRPLLLLLLAWTAILVVHAVTLAFMSRGRLRSAVSTINGT